ncbi:MAG: tRNA (adenosine(37)-N6)-dimethylallyltransferase MiaA [Kiritimatiellaeota bacterium]|nr:tRNA (adenosine(37)-N6)-dimethylallyltransferase MiaA [Kiritimatiellota bacterium]
MRKHDHIGICLAILGPTGSCKTDLALQLAERLRGEIVSCDSMQIYRELDIGTAKPDTQQRNRVPHHLIDLIDISERYDAHRFVHDASRAICAIAARGRIPILVGGSGLYAKCLIYGNRLPDTNPSLYEQLTAMSENTAGRDQLYREIAAHSPSLATSLRNNPRRLVRAVEKLRVSRLAPSEIRFAKTPRCGFKQFILYPAPSEHRARIARRTHDMLRMGWIDEVRRLIRKGLLQTPTARQALGYRTIAAFLADQESRDISQLEAKLVSQTWAYARRQRTWFRHQHPGALHIPLRPGIGMDAQLAAILSQISF